MEAHRDEASALLQLPDPCLLTVMQCLADDSCSLFSAARTHSRLHQAAVLALSSIKARLLSYARTHSVQLYLQKHGRNADSINLTCANGGASVFRVVLQLPALSKLTSLQLQHVGVQLQCGIRAESSTADGLPLKQLQLQECRLYGDQALEDVLLMMPSLQHLSIGGYMFCVHRRGVPSHVGEIPGNVLQVLQQLTLTHLELCSFRLQDPHDLQHLHGLTSLQALCLESAEKLTVTASLLSGLQQLTRLELSQHKRPLRLQPGALSGTTQLQHLKLRSCEVPLLADGSGGVRQLLFEIQQLQQLTFIEFDQHQDFVVREQSTVPAAAYSALTASTKLQKVAISSNSVPAGAWQHLFAAGRQLPFLRELFISWGMLAECNAELPAGSLLVSCCPGLRVLRVHYMPYTAELLAPLTGLSCLSELDLDHANNRPPEDARLVCQLTGLRRLGLWVPNNEDLGRKLLLQLTQLRQLTKLDFSGHHIPSKNFFKLKTEERPGEPVWRQILLYLLDCSDPEVAQQAAAALAEHAAAS